MNLQILPLAITMMAGPQIMSAIVFLTGKAPIRTSIPFVVAVGIAATAGVAAALGIASLLGSSEDLGDSGDTSATGTIIQFALVGLLIAVAIKNYVRRESVEPPKWMGALQEAGPRKAFTTGLLIILLMPSDIVIMLTVGFNLQQTGSALIEAAPFIGLTMLVAALPLLGYLLLGGRAKRAMPKLRDWMNSNAGIVNVIVCCIFIALILA